jgi:predicted nucleic-acid-binding Zn-ribbon protein
MRFNEKCPKCEGRVFAVNTLAQQPNCYMPGTWTLSPVTLGSGQSLGWFETWMCLGCGYTEFYACGLTGVQQLAAQHPGQLRIVDATSKEGPYR